MPSPFKTVGTIIFTPLSFIGQLLCLFLLSPWGLVVPMTLLIALFATQQLQKPPTQLALHYAKQFETCGDEELPRLLEVLVRMGDAGVLGLVKGLTSQRESVFTACLNVLQGEFDRWTESDQREHHYLIFSRALLDTCTLFSPTAQAEVMQFTNQLMRIRSAVADSPESSANRQKTIAHCERLLSQLESMRRRQIEQGQSGYGLMTHQKENAPPTLHASFAPSSTSVASWDRRTQQSMLFASNGQPFMPTSARGGDETLLAQGGFAGGGASFNASTFNAFSAERADRLAAYQRSQQNRPAESWGNPRFPDDRTTPLLASFSSPPNYSADVASKFAEHFSVNESESPDVSDISEEYRNRKLSESGGTFESDNVLSLELQNTPLDRVPHLPTTQLMQLLHHPESAYVESARRTLRDRDGFQEVHMKLAWRLFHPIPAVRREIMDMLPSTPNVQPSVWMTVLLNDPNNDVRYRTASFLATTNDPALQRLLIDRGKRDNDVRIVNLAERLNDVQRRTVRR